MAGRPGEVVGELIPLFDALNVGVRLAPEVREAGNIDGRIRAAGNGCVVKIRESSAGILKAELVDFVVAQGPRVLDGPGNVAESLLRRSRVGVLSEWLILAADFNSRLGARTDVHAQHKTVAGAHVVVDAQRILARPIEP